MDNRESMRLEALGDLRKCLEIAEELGCLEYIDGADPYLEIGALHELSLEKETPPILVFRNIKGYSANYRIAVNIRSSRVFENGSGLDRVRNYRKSRRKHAEPIPPVYVSDAPVLENYQEGDSVNVLQFPAPQWHEHDGGRYIGTECIVITKDPDSDWINVGTYRTSVHDKNTLIVFIEPGKHGDIIRRKYWERGEACPMVICVGQAPVLGAVAASTPPSGMSEYSVCGSRIGRPVSLVKGKITNLAFPAEAEIAFEGYMPPPGEITVEEGPFGEWPGYDASSSRPEPVLKVHAVYYRNDPIVVGAAPMKATLPGMYFGAAESGLMRAASLWDELEGAGVSGVTGVWKLPGGGPRFINVISIKQLHAGHAKMAGLVALGCGSNAYLGRLVIIVDDDIDITNPVEVMWAVATRWDPKTQTDIIDGCWTGHIDPMLPPDRREANDITNSRMVIYAVRPFHWKNEFPKVNAVDPSYSEQVRAKWLSVTKFLSEN